MELLKFVLFGKLPKSQRCGGDLFLCLFLCLYLSLSFSIYYNSHKSFEISLKDANYPLIGEDHLMVSNGAFKHIHLCCLPSSCLYSTQDQVFSSSPFLYIDKNMFNIRKRTSYLKTFKYIIFFWRRPSLNLI